MANHMPSPWTLANLSAAERGPVQIKSRHGLTVGTAYTVDDARLMAAAPEMYAVLESVYQDLVTYSKRLSGSYDTGAIALGSCADQIAAVITKAKGQD